MKSRLLHKKRNNSIALWNNSDQISKILLRLQSQSTIFFKSINKRASIKRLFITKFPYLFNDSIYPPSLHIEFTNACNLKCVYCNNPFFSHPREMMSDFTFNNLIKHISESKIDRICIGGGEPTLHPKFTEYVKKLAKVSKILTIVTNGHWTNSEIAKAMVTSPIDYIEISVESGNKLDFENTRIGSNYDLIIKNLIELNEFKKEFNSKSTINLRLMVRPSQKGRIETESRKFWKKYSDTIMPQYVLKSIGAETINDVFTSTHSANNNVPKCTLPFKNIQVRSNGNVPICQISGSSFDLQKVLIAGNINKSSLLEIWRGELFNQYRSAHRKKNYEKIPICKGCSGC